MLFLKEKYKLEEVEKAKQNYTNSLLYGIYQIKYAETHEGNINNKLKTFEELLDLLDGKVNIDTRSAEEIQETVLSKFRGTAGE